MLHKSSFLLARNLDKVVGGHLVLNGQLLDLGHQVLLLNFRLHDDTLDVAAFVLQLLVRGAERAEILFVFVESLADFLNLLLKALLLFL